MANTGDSSDTLIASPSPTYKPKPLVATNSNLKSSTFGSASPVVAKILREASDVTWQEPLELTKEEVPVIRRRRHFQLLHQQEFKNSLLASVGFLELANAGDFAANVWNQIPVPIFATVLMGIGGTLALGMAIMAVQDFHLSWRNVKLLRQERVQLQRLRQYHSRTPS